MPKGFMDLLVRARATIGRIKSKYIKTKRIWADVYENLPALGISKSRAFDLTRSSTDISENISYSCNFYPVIVLGYAYEFPDFCESSIGAYYAFGLEFVNRFRINPTNQIIFFIGIVSIRDPTGNHGWDGVIIGTGGDANSGYFTVQWTKVGNGCNVSYLFVASAVENFP